MNLVARKHRVCGEGRRIAIAVEELYHAWRKRQMIEAPASDHRLFQFGEREDGFADRRSRTNGRSVGAELGDRDWGGIETWQQLRG